jgi:hypothetical protein
LFCGVVLPAANFNRWPGYRQELFFVALDDLQIAALECAAVCGVDNATIAPHENFGESFVVKRIMNGNGFLGRNDFVSFASSHFSFPCSVVFVTQLSQ